jgi:hypothetical protein
MPHNNWETKAWPLFEGIRVLVNLVLKRPGEKLLPHGSGFSENNQNENVNNV